MPRQRWKDAEDRLAVLFGSTRRPLSGGNSKTGRDDSLHPRLFLECKFSKRHALWRLFREVRERAKAEKRTPVIGLAEKAAKGVLLVIHQDDLLEVAAEVAKDRVVRAVRKYLSPKKSKGQGPKPLRINQQ